MPAALARLALCLAFGLALAPGAAACTYATPQAGQFFLPADGGRAWVNDGYRIGLHDPEHGAWARPPLQHWVGSAAADPQGSTLVAAIVDDHYDHYCGASMGTGREPARARVLEADGTLRNLALDVAWVAGSAGGVAVALPPSAQGAPAEPGADGEAGTASRFGRIDVFAWGAWDAPLWTVSPQSGATFGDLAPSAQVLAIRTHQPDGVAILRPEGAVQVSRAPPFPHAMAFSPDSARLAVLWQEEGRVRVDAFAANGTHLAGWRSAGSGRPGHLAWGAHGLAVAMHADSFRSTTVQVLDGALRPVQSREIGAGVARLAWTAEGDLAYWDGGIQRVGLGDVGAGPESSQGSPAPAAGLVIALAVAAALRRRDGRMGA